MFRGTFTALVTPFRDGDIDVAALERLIERQIAAGVTGLVRSGPRANRRRLSHEEHEQVIELTVKVAQEALPSACGDRFEFHSRRDRPDSARGETGRGRLAPRRAVLQQAESGRLLSAFPGDRIGFVAADVLYNIPGRCCGGHCAGNGRGMARACANIVAIKEASGSVDRVSELRDRLPDGFTILSGDDSLTLPFLSVGAVGVVSVASNVVPAEVCELVRAFETGDLKWRANCIR